MKIETWEQFTAHVCDVLENSDVYWAMDSVLSQDGALEELIETGSLTLQVSSRKFELTLNVKELEAGTCEMCAREADKPAEPCAAGAPNKEYYCTRRKGHDGEHVACGVANHAIHRWPNNG